MNFTEININDLNYGNDYFHLKVAMNSATNSEINIFNIDGTGLFQYRTPSDYIFEFSRYKSFTNEIRSIDSLSSNILGYPNSIQWTPGGYASLLSQEDGVSYTLPVGQETSSLDPSKYHKGEFLVLQDYYNEPWDAQGLWRPESLSIIDEANQSFECPHVEEKTNNTEQEGRLKYAIQHMKDLYGISDDHEEYLLEHSTEVMALEIFSSQLKGSIFEVNFKKDFLGKDILAENERYPEKKYINLTKSSSQAADTLSEWNEIFSINKYHNADSIFQDGTNIDYHFYEELERYINHHWYGNLKKNLWGNAINDQSVNLSTRDEKLLKDNILYCYYYFGASDDIKQLGLFSYPDLENGPKYTLMEWHIGLGAKSRYSQENRKLIKQLSYLPAIKQELEISRVAGLSPRSSYAYDVEYNKLVKLQPTTSEVYSIVFTDTPHGSEAFYPSPPYQEGQEVLLFSYPEDNYYLESWEAKDSLGNDVPIVDDKIIIPASNVTVTATYAEVTPLLVNFIGGWMYDQPTTTQQMWQNGHLLAEAKDRNKDIIIEDTANMKLAKVAFNQSGLIGEVIIIDQNINLETRQKIEGYLAHKWTMKQFLPENHPYKYSNITEWGPADIGSPLVGWYDETSIVVDGANIIAWNDKTDSGANFLVPAGINPPVYSTLHGLPAILFDGSETTESDFLKTEDGKSPFLAGQTSQRQLNGLSCFIVFKYLEDADGFPPCGRASIWGHSRMSLNAHAPWSDGYGYWDIDAPAINRSRIAAIWMDCVFNITVMELESVLLSSNPDEGTIAYGTDTQNIYVYYGGDWYIQKDLLQPFNISMRETESVILSRSPADGTIAYGTDTQNIYIYNQGDWNILDGN